MRRICDLCDQVVGSQNDYNFQLHRNSKKCKANQNKEKSEAINNNNNNNNVNNNFISNFAWVRLSNDESSPFPVCSTSKVKKKL